MKLLSQTPQELKRIKEHTLKSFDNDVDPLFESSQRVSFNNKIFHFGIIRQIMAYIETCGAILCGWKEKNRKGKFNDHKVSTSNKAIKFIEDIMGQINSEYKQQGRLLYVMYRHGTTHFLRPHRVKSSKTGKLYTWKWYSGHRSSFIKTDGGINVQAKHLKLIKTKDGYELPVSMSCLCQDSRRAIEMFFDNLIERRKSQALSIEQRRALTFITEGIVVRGDI